MKTLLLLVLVGCVLTVALAFPSRELLRTKIQDSEEFDKAERLVTCTKVNVVLWHIIFGRLILKHAVELLSFNQLRMLNDQGFLP